MNAKTITVLLLVLLSSSCGMTASRSQITPSSPLPTAPAPTSTFYPTPTPLTEPTSLPPLQIRGPSRDLEPGLISFFKDTYGLYFLYRPTVPSDSPQTLAVIHGTPAKELSAEETAYYYAQHWAPLAEQQGWLLLVPVFNQVDFSSRHGEITDALTGYRGLFGREIGADEWVIRLLGTARSALGWPEAPILIYGHSAGGQYVARFLVTNPELVRRAVISAAVTYPQPDPEVAWPYGLGPLDTEIEWEDGTRARIAVQPDPEKWLEAAQVPTTVIVGLNDLEPQLSRPGQQGSVRLSIGRNWAAAMEAFAEDYGMESQIKFESIPGKGHSMLGLLPFCQAALLAED